MQHSILTIGKMKAGPESELFARYCDRAEKSGRQLGLSGPEITEWPESRAADAARRKREEAALISAALRKGGQLICLDERGRPATSREFAHLIRRNLEQGIPQTAFAVGGPDGLSGEIRNQAAHTLSFGAMTWPHQLARIMLAEQLYRATTILTGHPYHR